MKNLSIFLLFLIVCMNAGEAHRHHLDHHGKHHKEAHHGKHFKPHSGHDLKVSLTDLSTPENETITIDVTRKTTGPNNEKTNIKVSLRVHAIKGFVHINGHKVDHTVVTSLHVRTIIDEISPRGVVLRKPAIVQVRVMVTESTNAKGMRLLAIQEEILEVADDEVDQIDVKEIVLEFGNGIQEKRRTVTVIKMLHSKIHKHPREADKHSWATKGKLPKDPFCISKHEMKRWKHKHMRPPHFELGRNGKRRPDMNNDDDDDDDGNDKRSDDKHHHHRHHHHRGFKHWSRKFCAWFHKLPIAARAAFGISVVLFGILVMAACWTCCCRKPKAKPESKYELSDTASVDMECEGPLPNKKKPLDEQPLVA